eukprot:scaffold310_cov168-Amphora_coffeaeformis.AAC.56
MAYPERTFVGPCSWSTITKSYPTRQRSSAARGESPSKRGPYERPPLPSSWQHQYRSHLSFLDRIERLTRVGVSLTAQQGPGTVYCLVCEVDCPIILIAN